MGILDGLTQITTTAAAGEQAIGATVTGLTSLNNATAPGLSRSPRPAVSVNGALLPLAAVISVEVTNASHFTADSYRVELAVGGLPAAYNRAYWSSSANDQISVGITLNGEAAKQFILGQVDDIDCSLDGRTITLKGRDLSAAFIDNKTAEKFQNQTSSQIAQTLAIRRGLDSNVTATTTLAGDYYEIDHTVLTQEQTEWDLLIYLAQQEGFDVWVSGTTLYFQPPPAKAATPYLLLWSEPGDGTFASNAAHINVKRSQTLAKDIDVAVRSWNQKQQRAFTVHAKRTGSDKGQRAGGKGQLYTFNRPNLSRDQAQKLAQSILYDLSQHEMVLSASLPGDNALITRSMVKLVGTASSWDQVYYPDTVVRSLSMADGYRMELRAKNHATESTV
jgi:phage protein D